MKRRLAHILRAIANELDPPEVAQELVLLTVPATAYEEAVAAIAERQ